ncbi:MAG TPA: hypothetical protein VF902_09600 [Coriobacteriia bacterium]
MKRFAMIAALAAMVLMHGPAPASATAVTTRVVARTSGLEVASQLIAGLRDVKLGATGATVTVDVQGAAQPVHVDFGEITRGFSDQGGSAGGLLELAAIPVLGGMLLRLLRFLARLGGA